MSLIQHPYQLQVSFKSVILAYVKAEFTQRYTRHDNSSHQIKSITIYLTII